jgi:hypothetical protein
MWQANMQKEMGRMHLNEYFKTLKNNLDETKTKYDKHSNQAYDKQILPAMHCPENVGVSTSHNCMGLHGLLHA